MNLLHKYSLYVVLQIAAVGSLIAVFVIHPLIHGTPLDSGALDGLFAQLHVFGMGVLSSER